MSFKSMFHVMALALAFSPIVEAKPKAPDNNPNNFRPRAEGPTLGLGVGMSVPSESLDIYALRVRMNPNLIIEPMLHYSKLSASEVATTTMEEIDPASGDPTGDTTTSESTTNTDFSSLGGGLTMRYRFGRRGNTDLQAIGGVGYVQAGSESRTVGIEGSNIMGTTSMAVNAGVGVENFFAPKWSAGFDMTTPLYQVTQSTSTPADVMDSPITTSETSGIAISPTLRIMLVHYF